MGTFLGRAELDERAAQLLGTKNGIVSDQVVGEIMLLYAYVQKNFKLLWKQMSHQSKINQGDLVKYQATVQMNVCVANAEFFSLELVKAVLYEVERAQYEHSTNENGTVISEMVQTFSEKISNLFQSFVFNHQTPAKVMAICNFQFLLRNQCKGLPLNLVGMFKTGVE